MIDKSFLILGLDSLELLEMINQAPIILIEAK